MLEGDDNDYSEQRSLFQELELSGDCHEKEAVLVPPSLYQKSDYDT